MHNVLLIAPNFESDFAIVREILNPGQNTIRSAMVPLQHATLAALTPEGFQVDIWDEGCRGLITENTKFDKKYDIIGCTGYMAHIPRAIELAKIFRKPGVTVIMGGPGVSGAPESCREFFDVLFLGEAELTWPRFLNDWKSGRHANEYRQVERIDMSVSPGPRWDSIAQDIHKYEIAAVQTTRGCPFDCEFCDVIYLFGRKPRHKPVEHVVQEVVRLQKLGASRVFLCDDDFVGDPKYAKALLRALIPVNNSFPSPLGFTTQATIDAANDDELLELMADCNFFQLHIGIETPREDSLREAHKLQNLRTNLVDGCKKIQSYGIAVRALMIVGFDSDDAAIFAEQKEFVEQAHITGLAINTLKAYPGTPLWIRLQQEDRVLDMSGTYEGSTKVVTNIIPKKMTRVELLEGYRDLLGDLRSWDSIERRIIGFVSSVKRKPNVKPPTLWSRFTKVRKAMAGFRQRRKAVPPELRPVFRRVVAHTWKTAPYMLERAIGALMQHVGEVLVHPYQCQVIQKQIDEAQVGQIRLDRDPSAGQVPAEFKKKVRDVLPLVYDRLSNEMEYGPAVPEAMVAVIKDFVVRWGGSFSDFEAHHHTYVGELCDRYVERFNASWHSRRNGDAQKVQTTLVRDQVKSPQFVQALMASVEQELRLGVRSVSASA